MFSSVFSNLLVLQQYVFACITVCVCVCSLLAQVPGHITAFKALEVKETLGQPLGGLRVSSAAIGQSVSAATLQTLQTAQIALL